MRGAAAGGESGGPTRPSGAWELTERHLERLVRAAAQDDDRSVSPGWCSAHDAQHVVVARDRRRRRPTIITSPPRMPARAAPSPGVTPATYAPVFAREVRRLHEARRDGLGLHAHERDPRRATGAQLRRPPASADEIEIAKPMLFDDPGSAIAVLIPITRPSTSTSGPPELPGLIAASVWIASTSVSVPATCTVRPRPDTMPVVTVGLPAMPSALPIATTASPTWSESESPSSNRRQTGAVDLHDREVLRACPRRAPGRGTESPLLSVTTSCLAAGAGLGVRDVRVGDDDAARVDDEPGTGPRLTVDRIGIRR